MTRPRICAIIQSRMTSSRLPGKAMLSLAGKPALERMIERVQRAKTLDDIIVATTLNAADDVIASLTERLGVRCFRGSEHDLLGRVLGAARAANADALVRLTGDCVAIDPAIIDLAVDSYREGDADYVSTHLELTYPFGMDVEVLATELLGRVENLVDEPKDREHVTLYIYTTPGFCRMKNLAAPPELSAPRHHLALDTAEDYEILRQIFDALYPTDPKFGLGDILALLRDRADLVPRTPDVAAAE